MKRTIVLLISVFTAFFNTESYSQSPRAHTIGFSVCDKPRTLRIYNGQTFIMECDSAIIYNSLAWKNLVEIEKVDHTLDSLNGLNRILRDSIIALKDSVNRHLNTIISIQDSSYRLLQSDFRSADGLVVRSTRNTEKALEYVDQVKRTSVITGGLLGSVTGGVVGGRIGKDAQGDFSFSWAGAGIGLIIGAVVDYLLIR
ncbi:MAG: hypothetical protein HYR76_08450 [Ignavibacteria bacterium]|nr:hypothetical protein [Ignavibacteria bacterium]